MLISSKETVICCEITLNLVKHDIAEATTGIPDCRIAKVSNIATVLYVGKKTPVRLYPPFTF